MTTPDLQRNLLQKVVDRFPKKSMAVKELSKLLQVSPDGIYRRLRGDSILSPKEISLLAHAFNLSVDSILFRESDQVLFTYSLFSRPITSIDDYLKEVLYQAESVLEAENGRVSYATQEIPVFLYFTASLLFKFKMYIYARTYWPLPEFRHARFSSQLIPDSTWQMARSIAEIYNGIPSIEVWRPTLLDNTLNQICYLLTAGQFESPTDSLLILDAIEELIDHANFMAEVGKKSIPGESSVTMGAAFQLFFNEYSSTNDTILIESSQGKVMFTSLGMPNFLKTGDSRFLEEIGTWFEELTGHSTSLTRHASRARDQFFSQLSKKVDATRQRLNILLEEPG